MALTAASSGVFGRLAGLQRHSTLPPRSFPRQHAVCALRKPKEQAPEKQSIFQKLALPVAGVTAAALIASCSLTLDAAEAARSGGRVGGSSFSSRSAPRSSPRSSPG